jgi:hypothetical protein
VTVRVTLQWEDSGKCYGCAAYLPDEESVTSQLSEYLHRSLVKAVRNWEHANTVTTRKEPAS